MIFSRCTNCNKQITIDETKEIIGTWRLLDCDSCDISNVLEITQIGGKTHSQNNFEENILPNLENIEKIDHPNGKITIYANPEKIKVK